MIEYTEINKLYMYAGWICSDSEHQYKPGLIFMLSKIIKWFGLPVLGLRLSKNTTGVEVYPVLRVLFLHWCACSTHASPKIALVPNFPFEPWSMGIKKWNWLKKFMQVEVDVKCMQTNFGGCGLSGFGDFALFQKRPNFPFWPWTIVHASMGVIRFHIA